MGDSRSGGSLWVFYNIPRAIFFNGLTFQEARAIAKVVSPEERNFWIVWKEGWSQWKKLAAASELLATTSSVVRVMEPPPLPEGFVQYAQAQEDVYVIEDPEISGPKKISKLEVSFDDASETQSKKVMRKDQRVAAEIDIDIVCQGRKFSTTSVDISVSGVQVKDVIPTWMAGYATLVMRRPDTKQSLEFVCSIVEDQNLGDKRRLEIHPSKDTSHLKRWLLDFLVLPPQKKKIV